MAVNGTIYLIHFERPLKHARHYVGYCAAGRLDDRIDRHRSGNGAKLLRAVAAAGIKFDVVESWAGTRDDERNFKKRKSTPAYCPICRAAAKQATTTLTKGKAQ